MLHFREAELYDLFKHLPNTGGEMGFDASVEALNRHFYPQLNPDYERLQLQQAHQTEDETIDMFYARLRRLASTCTDIDQPDEIRAHFRQGCKLTV